MRSESAAHREPNRFCVPVLCFSSGIPVASAEPGRGRNFITRSVVNAEDDAEKKTSLSILVVNSKES